ncbi:MAG: hypothetical protein A2029_05705, partial [Chloroflexi bacterium RBG_19FT_COMBO_47_9]
MVSPEILHRFPFFGGLTDAQLRAISMITEEEIFEKGGIILVEKKPATKLFFLVDGSIDLVYHTVDEINSNPVPTKELMAGEVNSGEIFGVSALIEPYIFNATARAAMRCRVLVIDAAELRKLIDEDQIFANKM